MIVLSALQSVPVEALPAQALGLDEVEIAEQSTIAKIQAVVRRYVPGERSLVDELIANRRAEAERE